MKIFLHNKLKRLWAVLLAVSVLCCSLSIGVNTVAAPEDIMIVNDGSSTDMVSSEQGFLQMSVVDNISPDGKAFSISSSKDSGAGVINYKFPDADAEAIKGMQGFMLWVKVADNGKYKLMPNFNAEKWRFTGDMVAYNTYTGEAIEASGDGGIELPGGFEGYVILNIKDGRVKNAWNVTPSYTWSEFVTELGITSFSPYTYCSHIYEKAVTLDTFAFIADYEGYLAYLKAQPLPTTMPYSDTPTGIISEATRINLYAEEGASIYYTLDGTEPSTASTKYELVDLGDGGEPVSPILLTATTTIKAIAVKGERISRVATLSYEFEPPYDGPMDIIINDCSGEGDNNCSWFTAGKFAVSYVDGVSAEDKAMQVELLSAAKTDGYLSLGAVTDGIKQLHNVQALSYWVKVPETAENSPLQLGLHLNGQNVEFKGKIYALDMKKSTVQIFRDKAKLSDFEGLLIFDLQGATLNVNYGKEASTWNSYFKQNELKKIWLHAIKAEDTANEGFKFYADSFQIHYDYQAVLDKYEIEKIILGNTPNEQIVNSGDDIEKVSNAETMNTVTVEENISPNGKAYDIYGIANTGATGITFDLTQLDKEILSLKEAFSTWIRVPYGASYTFNPSFNTEGFNFVGTISTYNTITGEIETYENASSVVLSGFEGYVFLHLDGCGIKKQWTGETPYTWDEFIAAKDIKKLFIYLVNSQMAANRISIDSFAFISDLDKFIEELSAQPLRTMAPYSDTLSGEIPSSSFINLYAQAGADIHFTLDGTTPTTESEKYVMIGFGNGMPDVSPIVLVKDTVVKAIAVKDGVVSGVTTLEYTIEPPYDGPKDIIINDGSGEGRNIVGWSNAKFTHSYVDGVSPDGKAIKVELNKPTEKYADYYNIRVKNEGIEQLHNIEALSYWVKVPDLGEGKFITLRLYLNDAGNNLNGKIYALNTKDNTVRISKDSITLNDFEGVIIYVNEGDNVTTGYGKFTTNWYSYIKQNGLNTIWIYNIMAKDENAKSIEYYIDSFQIHYDIEALFEKYDIAGLLAKYDVGSAENTNMTVANDCSGYKINGGLSEISENLVLEASDYSPDDRSLKINFTKGDSTIGLPNFSTDADNLISDGITFWVDTKDAKADIELKFKVNELAGDGKEEIFEYSEKRWYYLIDKDGIIEKVYGKFILPENFRGWVVLPKESLLYVSGVSTFENGELDCDKLGTFTITFKNDDNKLDGKSIYFDDISFYLDFPTLVRSRARAWKGQIFY